MRLGAHTSTAGGAFKAFARADQVGCDSMLIFTKSNRQWNAKAIDDQDVENYKNAAKEYEHIHPVSVHASYLINLASPNPELREKSYLALKDEVERAAKFDIPYLTFHPGSFMDGDVESGLGHIALGLTRVLEETAVSAPQVTVCLETMAGQGTNLGLLFEQLATVFEQVGPDERLGVCLDTCHIFAAGYDIRTPEAYEATLTQFDQTVGLDKIKCFHLNDSKFDLGSRKDRHTHIGDGYIGLDGFANFINDPRWADYPAHLETPKTEKDEDGNEIDMDAVNLVRLRELIK